MKVEKDRLEELQIGLRWVDEEKNHNEIAAICKELLAARNLLIEAEALLCDEQGGPVANELAARIREHQSNAT